MSGLWNREISSIRPGFINSFAKSGYDFLSLAFSTYMAKKWQNPRTKTPPRLDLAILHNPQEKLPPSKEKILRKFIAVGKKMGIAIDLIEKNDWNRVSEYDALFIREPTNTDHYTNRLARKAESEGLVVIEVNDYPNIDAGIEDKQAGENLYRMILQEFLDRHSVKKAGKEQNEKTPDPDKGMESPVETLEPEFGHT